MPGLAHARQAEGGRRLRVRRLARPPPVVLLALAGEDDWRAAGDAAHAQAAAAFNLNLVCESWHGLLTADLNPALPGPILELLGSH